MTNDVVWGVGRKRIICTTEQEYWEQLGRVDQQDVRSWRADLHIWVIEIWEVRNEK